jgi:16S rRNA (cytosine1402-N4)-methyltransferase
MSGSNEHFVHKPVMAEEVIDLLSIRDGGSYIDGTLGSAGHSALIAELMGASGRLLGIDCDEAALKRARTRLSKLDRNCSLVHGNFSEMARLAEEQGMGEIDGILLDLGISSDQLDTAERGFSFAHDGPLDMRMDQSQEMSAAELVNGLQEQEMMMVIRKYGEDRFARRIARQVTAARREKPIETTAELAKIVERAKGGKRRRIHPATQTFQAFRIAVNDELEHIRLGLLAGIEMLRPGGRMAVIAFHSLEDRIVKTTFRHAAGYMPPDAGIMDEAPLAIASLINKKPLIATDQESADNPRARSAKLRVIEKFKEV